MSKSGKISETVFPFQELSLKNLDKEYWKPAKNFEDYYMVSNLGRVKTIEREINFFVNGIERKRWLPEAIKKQSLHKTWNPNTKDYAYQLFTQLKVDKKQSNTPVARMVYTTFTGVDLHFAVDQLIILHKDYEGRNNRIENLYASNFSDRAKKAFKRGRIKKGLNLAVTGDGRRRQALKLGIPVAQFDLNGKLVARFPSINDACRESNLSSASIRRAINKNGTAGGFIWMKGDDNKRPGKKMLKKVNTLNTIAVEQYSRDGKFLNRFISLSEAARQTGIDLSGISRALRVQGKSGGFLWKPVQ